MDAKVNDDAGREGSRKANFFLVGAPKAGTTSVDRLLRRHPDVFLSPIKEPCHFCPDIVAQIAPALARRPAFDLAAYLASRGRELVHLQHVASAHDYARLYDGAAGHAIVGECSTYYLSSRQAAAGIHAYNPAAKIMVLVRDPVARIRSHYAMERSLGLVARPLPALVEEELALGERANWGNCRYYVGASRYAPQLQRFRRLFPPEQVCVLRFEELVAGSEDALHELFAFLGIAPPAGEFALPQENKSRAARFPWLHDSLRGSSLKPVIAALLKGGLSTRLGRAAQSMYYRDKVQVVSDEELQRVRAMLREEGLETPLAHAA